MTEAVCFFCYNANCFSHSPRLASFLQSPLSVPRRSNRDSLHWVRFWGSTCQNLWNHRTSHPGTGCRRGRTAWQRTDLQNGHKTLSLQWKGPLPMYIYIMECEILGWLETRFCSTPGMQPEVKNYTLPSGHDLITLHYTWDQLFIAAAPFSQGQRKASTQLVARAN